MELRLSLALPRDELTIPVVRRTLSRALEVLGAEADCASDVEVAITEACTNVLDHARDGDDYLVTCTITSEHVAIEVVDRGRGFDGAALGQADAATDAEAGRGIQLMRALVDRIHFEARPEQGSIVHLEKDLVWRQDAPLHQLAAR